jgi:hypothetical protein
VSHSVSRLYPGDQVEVKSPAEIVATLDSDGTVGKLPFMPEMIEFCGQRFRVSKRIVKTCYYGKDSGMRKFEDDDVVILDGVRCSGAAHDDCQKACTIFWREAWLRRVDGSESSTCEPISKASRELLRSRLKTKTNPKSYFCQASEILNSTSNLSRLERITKCVSEVRAGNCTSTEMAKRIATWIYWKARKLFLGPYARGNKTSTPSASLNLASGEMVRIKSVESVSETLDSAAYNRGLYFTPAMSNLCGEQQRVERRIDKLIVDGTGEMRQLRNTVFLEGSLCGCDCVAFGGCPRGEYAYWREIWLNRIQDSADLNRENLSTHVGAERCVT